MRALLVSLLIHITLNPLLFLKGRNVFRNNRLAKTLWSAIFISELAIFLLTIIFGEWMPGELAHFGRVLGTSWMLFVIYVGGLILLFDFFYLLVRKKLFTPLELKNQPQIISQPLMVAIVIFVSITMIHGKYKFEHPVVTPLSITINKTVPAYDSLRIAVVGDMHLGYTINRDDARRMVDLVMAQDPDIILMVGDIIDASIKPVLKEGMGEELKRLHAPLGVYTCPGNHEYRNEADEKFAFLEESGITVLRDSVMLVDSMFYIVGREDIVFNYRTRLQKLIDSNVTDRSKPIFVLSHSPYSLDQEEESKADLALYGHTHHGQAFPGNIATRTKFELAYGYKKKSDTHFYVTSGIGLAGPQHRICTVSEVAMITVHFNQ